MFQLFRKEMGVSGFSVRVFWALAFICALGCSTLLVKHKVAEWYVVSELEPGFFRVDEGDHVTFYVLKDGDRALFIDSGMGLDDEAATKLLADLGIQQFDVLNTHAHCDHVGLNYRASNVFIDQLEWEKYKRQGELQQLEHYHGIYKTEVWPEWLTGRTPKQRPWQPTAFVTDAQITFGKWSLRPVRLPGHTVGSRVYVDSSGKIFTGDIIYDGTLYMHLKDSSLRDLIASLGTLADIAAEHPNAALYPGHNTIPLAPAYIARVQSFLRDVSSGRLKPTSTRPKDAMFEAANYYQRADVKMLLKLP